MIVPLTLADFLERAEQVYGDREAVIDEPNPPGGGLGRITYGEFAAMSRSLAAALDDLGVRDGERIAIVSPNAARFLVSLFGVSVFGRVIVPVNFRLNVEEVRYIIEHSGSTVALIDPELDEPLKQLNVKHRFVLGTSTDAQLFGRRDAAPRGRVTDENATVSINYTSGTTARPKGVQLTHRGCWLNAVTFGWHLGLSDRDVYLHTLADVSLQRLGHALRGHRDRRAPGDHPQDRRRGNSPAGRGSRGDPVQLRAGGDRGGARRGRRPASARARTCRAPGACGSWSPERRRRRRRSSASRPSSAGSSSRSTASPRPRRCSRSTARPRNGKASTGASGRGGSRGPACRPWAYAWRVDENGEILTRTNNVFEGYWNQPEETAKALADGWFHTGDGGHTEDAYVVIADRKKDVIITGGENVSSIEVEDCLYQHPAVAEAAVIGVPDEKWGETIKALVVLRPGAQASADDLVAFCRTRMAHYKCPTSIELRDALARTATGKLQKFSCASRTGPGASGR